MKKSKINLKYRLSNTAIKEAFNFAIDSLLQNKSFVIEEYDLEVNLSKTTSADITLIGKRLTIKFPLDIEAEKKTILKDLQFDGSIHVTAVSNIDIDNDWEFTTDTELVNYHWLEKPIVKMGILSLPIETILNIIIKNANEKFISQLDKTIQAQFSLRTQIEAGLGVIRKPITLASIDHLGLNITLDDFAMTHIKNNNEWTEGIISVAGESEIGEVKNLDVEKKSLPSFSWLDDSFNEKSSNLFFNVASSFEVINEIVRKQLIGRRFSEGVKETTITDIKVRGVDGTVKVEADIIGTYKGQVFVSVTPKYNQAERRFLATNIEVDLQTKNFLHRGLGWMLKGRIESELNKRLQFTLDDLLKIIKGLLSKKLKEQNEAGVTELAASIKQINIEQFTLTTEKLEAVIHLEMVLKISLLNFIAASKKLVGAD